MEQEIFLYSFLFKLGPDPVLGTLGTGGGGGGGLGGYYCKGPTQVNSQSYLLCKIKRERLEKCRENWPFNFCVTCSLHISALMWVNVSGVG